MRTKLRGAVAVALLSAVLLPVAALASDGIDAVRSATAEFEDVAAAEAAGYGILTGTPLEECIDEPGEGAMGFHYVNGDLVGDALVDAATPEALLYIPQVDGSLRFVGVEYVVFADAWDAENDQPPALFGHDFHLVGEPNRYELPPFYELHAWTREPNPSGTFNDWNPNVSCTPLPDTATGSGPATAAGGSSVPWIPLVLVAAALGALMLSARLRGSGSRPAA
jgi:hypothetical protein